MRENHRTRQHSRRQSSIVLHRHAPFCGSNGDNFEVERRAYDGMGPGEGAGVCVGEGYGKGGGVWECAGRGWWVGHQGRKGWAVVREEQDGGGWKGIC